MYKVIGIGWGWIFLLCIVFPLAGVISQFIFLLTTMYNDATLAFPIMLIPLFLLIGIFLWCLWTIGAGVNKRVLGQQQLENTLFKKAMYLCMAAFLTSLINLGTFDLFLTMEHAIPSWINTVLAFFLLLVIFTVSAALIYAAYFVNTVLKIVLKDQRHQGEWHDSISLFIKVLVFPLGMLLINKKLNEIL